MRVTCTGTLYMCLGQDDAADLREPLRRSTSDEPLVAAIRAAILRKPKGHDFVIARAARPAGERQRHVGGLTGGWLGRAISCAREAGGGRARALYFAMVNGRDLDLRSGRETKAMANARDRIETLIADLPSSCS